MKQYDWHETSDRAIDVEDKFCINIISVKSSYIPEDGNNDKDDDNSGYLKYIILIILCFCSRTCCKNYSQIHRLRTLVGYHRGYDIWKRAVHPHRLYKRILASIASKITTQEYNKHQIEDRPYTAA